MNKGQDNQIVEEKVYFKEIMILVVIKMKKFQPEIQEGKIVDNKHKKYKHVDKSFCNV